jgi:disulfide oxidoreductase YuzD
MQLLDLVFNKRGLKKAISKLEDEKKNLDTFISQELNKSLKKKYGEEKFQYLITQYSDIIKDKKRHMRERYEKEINNKIYELNDLYNELISLS